MNMLALRSQTDAPTVPDMGDFVTRPLHVTAPSSGAVARRLAALTAAAMPWLRKDVRLTPPDGGPEVFGAPIR